MMAKYHQSLLNVAQMRHSSDVASMCYGMFGPCGLQWHWRHPQVRYLEPLLCPPESIGSTGYEPCALGAPNLLYILSKRPRSSQQLCRQFLHFPAPLQSIYPSIFTTTSRRLEVIHPLLAKSSLHLIPTLQISSSGALHLPRTSLYHYQRHLRLTGFNLSHLLTQKT